MAQAANGADDIAVRADLLALPGHLDRIDAWIAEGTLGGEALHAGDLQVAASLRLLVTVGDVARTVDDAAGRHARAPRLPALPRRRAGRDAARRPGCRARAPSGACAGARSAAPC